MTPRADGGSGNAVSDEEMSRLIADAAKRIRQQAQYGLKDKSLAEDVAQHAMLNMWKNRASLESAKAFGAWSYTVTANAIKDTFKSQYARGRVVLFQAQREAMDTDADPDYEDERADVASGYEDAEERAILAARIASLRPHHREILELFAYQELSHAEIGGRLGISAELSKMRLHHAKQALFASRAMPTDTHRFSAAAASPPPGRRPSFAAICARLGVDYQSTYSRLRSTDPAALRRMVNDARIARRKASRWGVALEIAREHGFVCAHIREDETPAKARSALSLALGSSKLTMAWRWTTKLVGRTVEVRRAERWTTTEGDEIPDWGADSGVPAFIDRDDMEAAS